MSDISFIFERRLFQRILLHGAGFLLIFLAANWLREIMLRPNPILQGYLQITTGIFAFVFAAVALVRFQGTQDRISLILGSGFLLSGATLIASSILFFQLIHESQIWFLWAPVAWWISRLLLAPTRTRFGIRESAGKTGCWRRLAWPRKAGNRSRESARCGPASPETGPARRRRTQTRKSRW